MTAARQVARHRNRGETLELAIDLLVIDSVPPAAWAAVGAAAAGARVNSTGPSGQAMAVLDLAHRQHPTDRGMLMALVSVTRDTGDFEKPLRHARALVTLDSADTRGSLIAASVLPAKPLRIAPQGNASPWVEHDTVQTDIGRHEVRFNLKGGFNEQAVKKALQDQGFQQITVISAPPK